ncbi:MAG: RluA family pseudouridine synthase [Deltaproteobacteria bacterium]|jgi:23S rRNA pseudouridine1911/1915/1917 synthase|nr:RluA family pseudouridine synthase [Deltaproteobacteria bacterium]
MFQVGDLAVYPAHGVGRIESVESREVSGAKQNYYIMRILETNMIIMIPVQNVDAVGLREIINTREVHNVYDILRKRDIPPDNQTWNRRYRDYMEKIKTGSVYEVSEVLRDLFLLKSEKDLSFGERKMLDTAQTLLVTELAIAMKTEEEEIGEKINGIFREDESAVEPEDKSEQEFVASEKEEKQRLDLAIADQVADITRSRITNLIKEGQVSVNNEPMQKPGYRLKAGDRVALVVLPPKMSEVVAEDIPLSILYEDEDLLVINKQHGIVVHPAAGHTSGTLVNALLFYCSDLEGIGDERRPGIVHRLDKDTSGCILVAKNAESHSNLSQQFKDRTIRKTYLALVYGRMKKEKGSIALPIGRHPVDRKKMSTQSKRGRPSETIWTVKESFKDVSFLEITIKTGRTHQIRTHLSTIGHPVVGDATYGGKKIRAGISPKPLFDVLGIINRQMLHAWQLSFKHPRTGESVSVEAPLPEDMKELLETLSRERT